MTTLGQDKIQFKFRCTKVNITGTVEPDTTIKLLYEKEMDTHIQGPSRKQKAHSKWLRQDEAPWVSSGWETITSSRSEGKGE